MSKKKNSKQEQMKNSQQAQYDSRNTANAAARPATEVREGANQPKREEINSQRNKGLHTNEGR